MHFHRSPILKVKAKLLGMVWYDTAPPFNSVLVAVHPIPILYLFIYQTIHRPTTCWALPTFVPLTVVATT